MVFPNAASEFVYIRSYSRWMEEEKRRERWDETVDRYIAFIEKHTGDVVPQKVFKKAKEAILAFKVMPSMRAMWSAGPAAEVCNVACYNCCFQVVNSIEAFAEALYILMSGAGYGFSIEHKFVNKLPVVSELHGKGAGTFEIPDSKEGWADSIKHLMQALYAGNDLELVYDKIRGKGARLKTFGGRASGPAPLIGLHNFIRQVFEKAQCRQLSTVDCLDIMNKIAEIVVVGGVRRSSEISLSDLDDLAMATAKVSPYPLHRAMSNNSTVYDEKPGAIKFLEEWSILAKSGTGERGIFNRQGVRKRCPTRRDAGKLVGINPCAEVNLRDCQMCNLTEVVARAGDDLDDMLRKIETATWLGAIQSTFTKFRYLSRRWKHNCEQERLLGVSITGQMDNPNLFTEDALKAMKQKALKVAKKAAAILGVNMSAAVTLVKPSGCRPWNALVTTSDGLLTLEDLIQEHHHTDTSWSDVSGVVALGGSGPITKTYINGIASLMEIELSFGMILESTPNHQWWVKDQGWVRTDNLKLGNVLDVVSSTYNSNQESTLKHLNKSVINCRGDADDIMQPAHMSPSLAWLLGYLWGDGAMSPSKYRLRWVDQRVENLEKARQILKDIFGLNSTLHNASEHRKAKTLEVGSKLLWHWLIRNDVWKYYNDKLDVIPVVVRRSSRESIIAFLSGLIDADGWGGERTLIYTTADREFSKHVQHVGWAVGICLGRSLNSCGENFQQQKEMYLMSLLGNSDNDALEMLVSHCSKAQHSLRAFTQKKIYRSGVVKSIKQSEEKPTFDVETSEHWFYAGSVRSHNTVSQLVNASPGIHARHSRYQRRRYRIASIDPLCRMLRDQGIPMSPETGQRESDWKLAKEGNLSRCAIYDKGKRWSEDKVNTWVVTFPVVAPKNCVIKDDMTALAQLEYYKRVQKYWCEHNVSCTVYVKEHEWLEVGNWIYVNWKHVTGISFLPHDGGNYEQLPNEEILQEEYEKLLSEFPKIDYSRLSEYEQEDNTQGAKELACSGDKCDV